MKKSVLFFSVSILLAVGVAAFASMSSIDRKIVQLYERPFNKQNFERISYGMTYEEVSGLMGREGYHVPKDNQTEDQESFVWIHEPDNVVVVFDHGKASAYGGFIDGVDRIAQ